MKEIHQGVLTIMILKAFFCPNLACVANRRQETYKQILKY